MSVAANQKRVFLQLRSRLLPLDRRFPERLKDALSDRRFGGRDRRLYRELAFTAARLRRVWPEHDDDFIALVATACAATPDTAAFRAAFARGPGFFRQSCQSRQSPAIPDAAPRRLPEHGQGCPCHLTDGKSVPRELFPAWALEPGRPAASPATAAALLSRASLWLRLQTATPAGVAAVEAELAGRGWPVERFEALPTAWRLPPDAAVTSTESYRDGRVEVQDLGSQFLIETVAPAPGGRWLDACAGAGGKTLQLAQLLGPQGRVEAHDIRAAALAELRRRAQRGGFANIRTLATLPPAESEATEGGGYDGVLVDAPCSGTGTWRRAPHLMHCTTPEDITRAARRQRELLDRHAPRVRPGGLLVYATCSLCDEENSRVAAGFLEAHGDVFEVRPPVRTFGFAPDACGGLTILPERYDTDGFYVVAFHRRG
ncbi:tRNA/rRNA cytosine-C5-methylase [Opitutaceae bacterium TAV1]|nr:tRNA/rRNA cytosine-C5-methylase [Opitutaceae bacterium TAV1]